MRDPTIAGDSGGKHASRGFETQDILTLFYMLARALPQEADSSQPRLLHVTIEQDEDALFTYEVETPTGLRRLRELVQTKKSDSTTSHDRYPGYGAGEELGLGEISITDVADWIGPKSYRLSIPELLATQPDTYYTALVAALPKGKAKDYVPAGLRDRLPVRTASQAFLNAFPVTQEHTQTPDAKQRDTPEVAASKRRMRLIGFETATSLRLSTELLLRLAPYSVSDSRSSEVLEELLKEIRSRRNMDFAGNRTLGVGWMMQIINAAKLGKGSWQDADEYLKVSQSQPADPNRGERPRFVDYKEGRFYKLPEYEEAWEALRRDHFVLLSGPPGAGKTVLVGYLMYRYKTFFPERAAYFLGVTNTSGLDDEERFFENHLGDDVLFIIDDENQASRELGSFLSTFTDRRISGSTRAWVVVTTQQTYTRRRTLAIDDRQSEFKEATPISLPGSRRDIAYGLLQHLSTHAQLKHGQVSTYVLAEASDGNFSLALLLARCSQEQTRFQHVSGLITSRKFSLLFHSWLKESLNRSGTPDHQLEKDIRAVFFLAHCGLPTPLDFNESVPALVKSGFLETLVGNETLLYASDTLLASVLSETTPVEQRCQTVHEYFSRFPESLPILCARLSIGRHRALLSELARSRYEAIFDIVSKGDPPLSLAGIAGVIAGLMKARPERAERLVRDLCEPYGQLWHKGLYKLFTGPGSLDLRAIASFIGNARAACPEVMEALVAEQVLDVHHLFEELCIENLDRLDLIGSSLRAFHQCSPEVGLELLQRISERREFGEFAAGRGRSPEYLLQWVRFCESIRPISRSDCHAYIGYQVQESDVVELVQTAPADAALQLFFVRLRRLQPKKAYAIVKAVWERSPGALLSRVRSQQDINVIANEFYALSRANRTVAVALGQDAQNHLAEQVRQTGSVHVLASALMSIRGALGWRYAGRLAECVDRDLLLTSLDQDYRVQYIGKSLVNLWSIDRELAAWLESNIQFSVFLERERFFEPVFVAHFIAGLLVAVSESRYSDLHSEIVNSELLREGYGRQLQKRPLYVLCQVLDLLRLGGLKRSDIIEICGFRNREHLRAYLLEQFEGELSAVQAGHGLLSIARFDPALGHDVLMQFMHVREADRLENTSNRPERRSASHRRGLPQFYRADLGATGLLLRVVAAIDPPSAHRLLNLIGVGELTRSARNEANVSRLSQLILGANDGSHAASRELVASLANSSFWKQLFMGVESFWHVVAYADALGRISQSQSRQFVRFICETYAEEVLEIIELEADAKLTCDWLRLVNDATTAKQSEFSDRLIELLLVALDMEWRLHILVEALQTLLDCGRDALANDLAVRVQHEGAQIRTIRELRHWVSLAHRLAWVGSRLPQHKDFAHELLSCTDGALMHRLLASDPDIVVCGHAQWLMGRNYSVLLHEALEVLRSHNERQMREGTLHSVNRVLGAIFLADSPREATALVEETDWKYLWQFGLAQLLLRQVHHVSVPLRRPDIADEIDYEHQSNLQFGLVLLGLSHSIPPVPGLDKLIEQASERARDESRSEVRTLLLDAVQGGPSTPREYYVWSLLTRSVLRPSFLSDLTGDTDEAVA